MGKSLVFNQFPSLRGSFSLQESYGGLRLALRGSACKNVEEHFRMTCNFLLIQNTSLSSGLLNPSSPINDDGERKGGRKIHKKIHNR